MYLSRFCFIKKGKILTFGIKPNRSETAFGYLEISDSEINTIQKAIKFIEKPNLKEAKKMFVSNKYLGIPGFFFLT